MKNLRIFALVAVAAFALSACNNVEKILPKKDGRWHATQTNAVTVVDGVETLNITATDSLGYSVFNSDGTGYNEDEAGVKGDDFTWSFKDDVVTITQDSFASDFAVLESSKKEQKWSNLFEITIGTIKTEVTTIVDMERADK